MVKKIICSSKKTLEIALEHGWEAGACYENYRDIKHLNNVSFIDINWKNYDFDKHLSIVKKVKPHMTVARDIDNIEQIDDILMQAEHLQKYCTNVIIVPKDKKLKPLLKQKMFKKFILGFSVPTKYGGTEIETKYFKGKVHLLGGRPDVQRQLANEMDVISIDCNRITLDARYGDYFVGNKFTKHASGGYYNCIEYSIQNVNKIWEGYNKNRRVS